MLDGAKNWNQWYNYILAMCKMSDIDGIYHWRYPMPVQTTRETEDAFDERAIYRKKAN